MKDILYHNDFLMENRKSNHAIIKKKPPNGVKAPNILLFVKHNTYNEPENKKTPISTEKNAYLIRLVSNWS